MEFEKQDDSLFYCDIDENHITKAFISYLRDYSAKNSKQIYILKNALGTGKEYVYDLTDIAIILIPKHPILLLNYSSENDEELENFLVDFKEDLSSLAAKFDYNKILGRARKWPEDFFITKNINNFDITTYVNEEIELQFQRRIDLLISLLIGSINSIERVGTTDPDTLLDKVKQKIILFDGQQSRFIYQPREQKTITIQGMAGTGKTELLLHKLKDVYLNEKDSVIAFTCFNKVLANDMKSRIPQFFNFLKVEEQIEWNKRLHVFSSWGSANDFESGLYSFICSTYNINFKSYRENPNFNILCSTTLSEICNIENFEPCFDYLFIDESQDFKESFFALCEKVTRKKVYIAGDIFQNIYDTSVNTDIKPDFLLNKCYRTDPKTLMFAHAVGMGLYESPPINWLEDSAWIACGYSINREEKTNDFILSRQPLRRFEDLDATNTIRLSSCNSMSYNVEILNAIQEIKNENPSVQPEDISIIILSEYKQLCSIADEIAFSIYSEYNWYSSKGYETKKKEPGKVYISNVNNVKGLEFPFVICVIPKSINSNILTRNSIYMALTRSFLTSYFIIDEINEDFYSIYSAAVKCINEDEKMTLHEPTAEERKEMENKIQITLSNKKSFDQIMDDFFSSEYPLFDQTTRKFVKQTLQSISGNLSEDQIKSRAHTFIKDVMGAGLQ